MPSFKISQLSELTTADDADFFEIVDDSELTISDKNKRITFDNLKLSIYSDSRIDTAFPAWSGATTYDSADNPQYVSYQSRLYQFTKSSGTDTGTTPGTDITVWAAVGGVEFFAPPATDAEAAAKTATNRYLTPANLAASGVVDTLYSVDGSLTSNRTVTLGTYTLDINLDSTGTFAIQDGGTDVFTVNASGNVNVQNNELYFGGTKVIEIDSTLDGLQRFGVNILNNYTGTASFVFGHDSYQNTTGEYNYGFGSGLFTSTTTAVQNMGFGRNLGQSLTTGGYNINIGSGINYTDATTFSTFVVANSTSNLQVPAQDNSVIFGRDREYLNWYYNLPSSSSSDIVFNHGGGTGTNKSQQAVINKAQQSTGSGTGGIFKWQGTPSGASGSTENTYVDLFVLDPEGDSYFDNTRLGIGTTTPNASSILDLSSTTGALLLTRMTTTERNALTAVNGMIIYNSTTNAFNFYENGAWVTGSGLV